MAFGFDFLSDGPFDLMRDVVITRHSTGPCIVNRIKYKYFSKTARFDYIKDSPVQETDFLMIGYNANSGSHPTITI